MIFNNYISYLWYFLETSVCLRCKAKAIAADNRSGVNNDLLSYFAMMVYGYGRMDNGMVTNFNIITNKAVGIYFNIISYLCIFS